ncbi:uncharacterized protein LOC135489935 [Lineus longissimus]|uniref:uncharacterized protein LOC135489935 n=1 Tax=Lineus longissimus TaxID=88925 RepID=UPI00315DA598
MKKVKGQQLMAPLPDFRVTIPVRAFSRCGVDYAGPFFVKISRKTSAKRYICLFTCTTSRAVHLEVAYSLDTSSFLNAFFRMVARRGKPEFVVSDNGTNFVGANRELKELVQAMDQSKIVDQAANDGIEWKFNPPTGSHHGGLFESMVKQAKRALSAVVEVEGLLNSRPLSYCSDSPNDPNVLTPNHFIYGQAGGQLAPRVVDSLVVNPRNRWCYVQQLICDVWKRWMKEILTDLNRRGKWYRELQDVQVDDVCILVNQTNPRGKWPLGVVTEVFPGTDGHVRVVKVKSGGQEYIRPNTRLCPFVVKK